jgi:hypothetical protein
MIHRVAGTHRGMSMHRWTLAAALLLGTGPIAAGDGVATGEGVAGAAADRAPPAGYEAAIGEAEAFGRLLFVHRAAQENAAARSVRGFRRDRAVVGVLSTAVDDGIEVEFIGVDDDGAPQVRYRATTDAAGRVVGSPQRLAPAQALAPDRVPAFQVQRRAAAYPFARCGEDAGVVVLPDPAAGEGALRAYVLAQAARNAIAAGGNFRMDVAADGGIAATRGFTNTCVQLQDDPRAAAMVLTHLLDPQPTEIHVLVNLVAGRTLFLVTAENRKTWKIHDGAISLVDEGGEEGP